MSFGKNGFPVTQPASEMEAEAFAYLTTLQKSIYASEGPLFPSLSSLSPATLAAIMKSRYSTHITDSEDQPTDEFFHNRATRTIESYRREPWKDPFSTEIWESHSAELYEASLEVNPNPPRLPVFGTLPTRSLNAYAIRVPNAHSFVIVFNSGLTCFLNSIAKVVVALIEASEDVAGKIVFYSSADWIDCMSQSLLTALNRNAELRDRFQSLLQNYLLRGDPFASGPHIVSPDTRALSLQLLLGAERFILGHELSHVFLGHLSNEARLHTLTLAGQSLEVLATLHEQEVQADDGAAGILSALLLRAEENMHRPQVFIHQLAGVPFLFQVLDLWEKAQGIVLPRDAPRGTHPSPFSRLVRTCLLIDKELLIPIGQEAREAFYGWMNTYRLALEHLSKTKLFSDTDPVTEASSSVEADV